jgi:hypothetical protein
MKLQALSFLNPAIQFSPCPNCTPQSRYHCRTCFGTGLLCPTCVNSGFKCDGSTRIEPCACGMNHQQAYYYEWLSLSQQNLVNLLVNYEGDVPAIQSTVAMLMQENYLHTSQAGYSYSRFVFTATRIEQFILARYSLLAQIHGGNQRRAPIRGFVYVAAPQLNDRAYYDRINDLLNKNQSAVAVYMGVSHKLPSGLYPYLPHITANLHRPLLIFATPEWFNDYKFLIALNMDKKERSDG